MIKKLHLLLAQINPTVGNIASNAEKIEMAWRAAPNADLVVFPELALCGYPPEDLILKPSFLDACDLHLAKLAAATADLRAAALVTAPARQGGLVYNAVHLIHAGKILATRFKHELPNYGVFDEKRIFEAAPLQEPVEFMGIKLGVMICEDMWLPESAAYMADRGAEILIVCNASPFEIGKQDTRLSLARERCLQTGKPLVFVNICGGQDEIVFDGGSFVMNESGHVMLEAPCFAEKNMPVIFERQLHGYWMAAITSPRPSPSDEEIIYQALMMGLRDYVIKNGFSGVLLGLSGGVDSALVAALSADALGAQAVRCVMLPSKFTSQMSLEDAQTVARNLGCAYETISIDALIESFHEALETNFPPGVPSVTFENIQPRIRGTVLMALSNASGHLLLTTGNKSELASGYATLYGDMCGGFNPLKDVYKTMVYKLVRWRNGHKPEGALGAPGAVIPERILTRAPSAELKPCQTDQDTLPPYDVLDGILNCLIEKEMSLSETAALGYNIEIIRKIWRMLDIAEFKRRQAAPGVKITSRAFGRERRYPITNGFYSNLDKTPHSAAQDHRHNSRKED